jgi:hypothetical protein
MINPAWETTDIGIQQSLCPWDGDNMETVVAFTDLKPRIKFCSKECLKQLHCKGKK